MEYNGPNFASDEWGITKYRVYSNNVEPTGTW